MKTVLKLIRLYALSFGFYAVVISLILPGIAMAGDKAIEAAPRICGDGNDYRVRQLDSDQRDALCETYKGKAILVVNTASRCAYTDQYDDLERLYANYRKQGLVVLGFPSNDFGNQEPGSEKKIKSFCRLTYGVQFPMYAKTRVKGDQADPLYLALRKASGQSPAWNFHKYLIDREGRLAGSFGSHIKPNSTTLLQAIEEVL
jgi:glutathione peroxidase